MKKERRYTLSKKYEIQKKINEITLLKDKTLDTGVIQILDSTIEELQKSLKIEESKSHNTDKKQLQEKLGIISEKIKKAELNNDLQLFQSLQKEKKEIKKSLNKIQGEIKYLNISQLKRILKMIGLHSNTVDRDKLIILLAFELGLRAGEVIDLRISDIRLDTGEIYCRRSKGSIINYIKISDSTIRLLKEYLRNTEPKDNLFLSSKGKPFTLQGLNYLFKRYSVMSKIPKDRQHFHTLKHSRGVYLAEEGFTIQEIKYLLGHKDIKSTMIYSSFSKAQKEAIYQKLESIQF